MMQILNRIKHINWHKGNGAILLGTFFCVMSFVAVLLVYEYCNVYCAQAYSQTRADLIADGSAEYANAYGELDETKTREMAQQLAILNSNEKKDIHLTVRTDSLNDQNQHDSLLGYENAVHIKVKTEIPYLFHSGTFETVGKATTRVVPKETP